MSIEILERQRRRKQPDAATGSHQALPDLFVPAQNSETESHSIQSALDTRDCPHYRL